MVILWGPKLTAAFHGGLGIMGFIQNAAIEIMKEIERKEKLEEAQSSIVDSLLK